MVANDLEIHNGLTPSDEAVLRKHGIDTTTWGQWQCGDSNCRAMNPIAAEHCLTCGFAESASPERKAMMTPIDADAHFAPNTRGDAYRLLTLSGELILLVQEGDGNSWRVPYLLKERSGLWQPDISMLAEMHNDACKSWAKRAIDVKLDTDKRTAILKWLTRVQSPRAVQNTADYLHPIWLEMKKNDVPVTLGASTTVEKLDADRRYIGAPNGVIDLHTGKLLPPDISRDLLVTRSIADDYDPDAVHPDADRLVAHLETAERDYLEAAIGYHLRHGPSRRIYVLAGLPSGGKSTLFKAIRAALGDVKGRGYAMGISANAIMRSRLSVANQHHGNIFGIQDALFASVSEFPEGRDTVNVGLLKQLDGVEDIVLREVSEKAKQARPSRAALFIAVNEGDLSRIELLDNAFLDRVRILRYPKIPAADAQYAERLISDVRARQAVMAWLVRCCVAQADATAPPADIESVKDATEQRRLDSIGELGLWYRDNIRVTGDGADFVSAADIWERAKAELGERDGLVDGRNRRSATTLLREVLVNLPSQTREYRNGKRVRGYAGTRFAEYDDIFGFEICDLCARSKSTLATGTVTMNACRECIAKRNDWQAQHMVCDDCGAPVTINNFASGSRFQPHCSEEPMNHFVFTT